MRVLLWHVHGSWTNALVRGPHEYVLPVVADRGPDGIGRSDWPWPERVVEVPAEELRDARIDVAILQRPHEPELLAAWTGRRAGHDLPAVYVEHNAPQGRVNDMRHPIADRPELVLVHVTHFNDLFWDAGATPARVIEHGVVDPGYHYTGELPRAAVAINEARRRARVTGTDLLERFAAAAPLDVFGIDADAVGGIADLPQERLHPEMGRRRAYLHPIRWTSLGLSLLEAMHVGLPVVALATTEAVEAVPPAAGCLSTDVDRLAVALRRLVADRAEARERGLAAREAALARYGLGRFLADWDDLLAEVAG